MRTEDTAIANSSVVLHPRFRHSVDVTHCLCQTLCGVYTYELCAPLFTGNANILLREDAAKMLLFPNTAELLRYCKDTAVHGCCGAAAVGHMQYTAQSKGVSHTTDMQLKAQALRQDR